MHFDSGGLTRSSETYLREVYLTVDLAKGLTESRRVCQLVRGRANYNCRYLSDGITTSRSRMMGDYHVRFCERLRGEIPLCLLDFILFILFSALEKTYSLTSFGSSGWLLSDLAMCMF